MPLFALVIQSFCNWRALRECCEARSNEWSDRVTVLYCKTGKLSFYFFAIGLCSWAWTILTSLAFGNFPWSFVKSSSLEESHLFTMGGRFCTWATVVTVTTYLDLKLINVKFLTSSHHALSAYNSVYDDYCVSASAASSSRSGQYKIS